MSPPQDNPEHLYEADKWRIVSEAKVRTALEDPEFAEREFQKWKERDRKERDRDKRLGLDNYWSKLVWVAEGRTLAMGRILDKVSRRLGKQREINRAQRVRIAELEAHLERLSGE